MSQQSPRSVRPNRFCSTIRIAFVAFVWLLVGSALAVSSVSAQSGGNDDPGRPDSTKTVLANGAANTHIDNIRELNSPEDDATPVIMPDESTIYFTSYRDGNKPSVFVSHRATPTTWSAPEKFIELPGKESISSISFSSDATHAIVGCCNRTDAVLGSCDLYDCDIVGGKVQNLHPLPKPVNSEWWEGQPCLSQDGQLLFFASDRKHGKGGIDIYMCARTGNGGWSDPIDLDFNTSGDELSPMIASDNQTLYFAANDLPGGLGGFDIYMTHRTGQNTWTTPKNLGPSVNSKRDEMFFAIPPNEDAIYLSSDREGGLGKFDIYRISPNPVKQVPRIIVMRGSVLDAESGQPIKVKPDVQISLSATGESVENTGQGTDFSATVPLGKLVKVKASAEGYVSTFIEVQSPNDLNPAGFTQDIKLAPSHGRIDGHVTNAFTHKALEAKVLLQDLSDAMKPAISVQTGADGAFTFNVNPGTKYQLSTSVDNYEPYSVKVDVPVSQQAIERILKEIYLTPTNIQPAIILFDFAKSDLKHEETLKLQHFIQQVKENPSVRIEVNGHTDDVGSEEANKVLSEKRAATVQEYLLSQGVPEDQLAVVQGFGKAQPVDPGTSEAARQKNRRVEVRIVGKQ